MSRLELFLGFDWQWVCCVDYSSLGWCIPHIQCRWQLCICTYDIFRSTEKYFLVAKVQKPSWSTLDISACFKFVFHLSKLSKFIFQFATDVTTATAHLSCFFNFLPLHFNIYIPVLSSYISISLSASAGCKPGCCCKLLIVHTRHFLGHISHASLQPFSIKIPKLWRCKL